MTCELSGLVIAKDEARELPICLQEWSEICRDLIVVDDQSEDETPEIARSYGAKVIDACMDDTTGFAGLRNAGLEVVQTSHVLVFDADERPTKRILQSIQNATLDHPNDTAYRFLRRNNAFGGWLDNGRFSPDWQIRLFPSSVRYQGLVHEQPILGPEVEIQDLEGIVEHYTYRSIGEYITKMRLYAEKSAPNQQPPSINEIFKVGHKNLFKKDGYKDGWRGLVMAIGDGWHEYLLRRHGLKSKEPMPASNLDLETIHPTQ